MKQIRVVLFHNGLDRSVEYTNQINEQIVDEATVVDINDPRPVRLALPIRATPNVAILLFVDSLEEGRDMVNVLKQLDYFKREDDAKEAFEILSVDSSDMSIISEKAREMRNTYMSMAAYAPDEEATAHPEVFDFWDIGVAYVAGDIRRYIDDKLYRVLQAHTSQADWTPDVTPALWEVIVVDHAGTLEDPIPASRNMAYENGKYYYDSEDDNIYLCNRDTEISVAYMPHELIGHYFVLAE